MSGVGGHTTDGRVGVVLHGHTGKSFGGKPSPTYTSWISMKQRCENPRHSGYAFYGARGITICTRWASFETFLADMGPRPTRAHSIDRKDPNGNYEPDNCRWATRLEQGGSRRNNRLITAFGETLHVSAWSRKTGVSITAINDRIARGWNVERALTEPARRIPTWRERIFGNAPSSS